MGRSKPAPISKPQAKTAHIKRVYSGEFLPSYEAAVAQYQQSGYNSYNPGYNGPAVQKSTYSAPAIQQPTYNWINGWDAWGAKLAEEEHFYGCCFFAADQPMDIVGPDNATDFLNDVPRDIGCLDVPMLTPSPSVVSMDVDISDGFLMNVDDPNEMDVDLVVINAPAEVAIVKAPPILANNLMLVPRSSSYNARQQNKRQVPPVTVNSIGTITSTSCNTQPHSKRQGFPMFIPARSMYSPETLETVQAPPPKPSPPKLPQRSTLPKATAKPSKSIAQAITGNTSTNDVERVIERFRRLQLSDNIMPPSKLPIDRGALAASSQVPSKSSEIIQHTVTFSSEDLVSLSNDAMHSSLFEDSQPAFTGIWEDLASLEKAFIQQVIPPADNRAVELVQSSEKEYSDFFNLRDIDWELASKTTPAPKYQENEVADVFYAPVTTADLQKKSPSKFNTSYIKNTSRRYKTKPKKILILGLPLNTLQKNGRKNKLTSALAGTKNKKLCNAKTTHTLDNVSHKQSAGDRLIRKALANARLETPKRSRTVAETVASNQKARASLSSINACAQPSPHLLSPVKQVAEVPSYTERSCVSFSMSFAITPASLSVQESLDLYDEPNTSNLAPSPSPARHNEAPTYTPRYTSFSLSFDIAPSTTSVQDLANRYDEEISSLVSLQSMAFRSHTELDICPEPLQAIKVVDKVFPGAFPMVEDNVCGRRGPGFLAWLSLHVFGW